MIFKSDYMLSECMEGMRRLTHRRLTHRRFAHHFLMAEICPPEFYPLEVYSPETYPPESCTLIIFCGDAENNPPENSPPENSPMIILYMVGTRAPEINV